MKATKPYPPDDFLLVEKEVAQAFVDARDADLAWCKVDADLFQSLGIGRALQHGGSRKGRGKVHATWWAPKDLVALNRTLTEGGVSRKLRRRTLQFVVDGKKLPKKANDVLALYAESLFDQPNTRTT